MSLSEKVKCLSKCSLVYMHNNIQFVSTNWEIAYFVLIDMYASFALYHRCHLPINQIKGNMHFINANYEQVRT